ncbi:hypothetical protein F4860DRAFT_512905 [Xylaria cubensis]|nr:hypothetical protein F4860DRAFT_512905 [Xylaria cubensis]
MILGNGDIVTGSKDESLDLLNGAAGALGTLGITTLLELRLVPAKRFAEIYDADNDYADAIMFSDTEGNAIRQMNCLIASGLRLSVMPGIHASDYVPLPEYLFRWDRGGFWVGNNAFNYFGLVLFNSFSRWDLND